MKDIDETEATVGMSDSALNCRGDYRHQFPRFHEYVGRAVTLINKGDSSMVIEDHCQGGCGVTRRMEFSLPWLALVSRYLVYPKNEDGTPAYLLPPDLRTGGRLTAEEIRRAQLARALQFKNARRRKIAK